MNPNHPQHNNHSKQRSVLRTIGPAMTLMGLIFLVIGMISFFRAFGSHGPPKYFWCAFVGMPLTFIGLVTCKFAYMGKIARYAANEMAPVGKDTFNYMARGTQEGVEDISEALFKGKSQAESDSIKERLTRLNELKNQGLINEDDFNTQKDRIISEL
jgi:uncharacterized membrane protein